MPTKLEFIIALVVALAALLLVLVPQLAPSAPPRTPTCTDWQYDHVIAIQRPPTLTVVGCHDARSYSCTGAIRDTTGAPAGKSPVGEHWPVRMRFCDSDNTCVDTRAIDSYADADGHIGLRDACYEVPQTGRQWASAGFLVPEVLERSWKASIRCTRDIRACPSR